MNSNIKKRIDSLGRIVVPKQIREELKINDFDELNISVEGDYILLKKSIGIAKYKDKLDRLLEILKKAYDFDIIVVYNEYVVSSSRSDIVFGDHILNFDFNKILKNEFVNFNINNSLSFSSFAILDNLINDSNLLGHLIVIRKESLSLFVDDINLIKKLIIDLI